MAKPARTIAPRLDRILLPELDEADASVLTPGADLEGVRVAGGDLSERDLTGIRLREVEIAGVSAHDVHLRGADIAESVLDRWDAPVLRAPRATLRDVVVSNSRVGSVEFYENTWQAVHFVGCKLGFVNLRGATLRDVRFTDCTVDELDLGGARVERLAFTDSDVRSLDVTGARLSDADLRGLDLDVTGVEGLRGATMDELQVALIATRLAEHVGIRIVG
ncbi:pentapeptide repeat-containing protein [Agromyces allii]|uniref:Pentapeptide repeat-containing protein n=1 Tax=Agromyces allii TaxID=393607 RepID=A0ABN2R622_9MICO|nr:pentapeptide repeat-containing protein [Agromyces allii]